MSYKDKFSRQWDQLTDDFLSEFKVKKASDISVSKMNQWFKTESFRWQSIISTDGQMLEQLNNKKLRKALLEALDDFSFSKYDKPDKKKPQFGSYAVIAVLISILVGSILILLSMKSFWMYLLVIAICFSSALIMYASNLDSYKVNREKEIVKFYGQQLKNYKEKLMTICDKLS